MLNLESTEGEVPFPLLELEADYDCHKGIFGVLLKAKAPKWEELFKKISGGNVEHFKKDGVETDLYVFNPTKNDRSFWDLFPSNDRQLLTHNPEGTRVLLYFLRMPGVGSGVEVFLPGIFENDTIQRYAITAGERAMGLFKKLSPGGVKMKVWVDDWKEKAR